MFYGVVEVSRGVNGSVLGCCKCSNVFILESFGVMESLEQVLVRLGVTCVFSLIIRRIGELTYSPWCLCPLNKICTWVNKFETTSYVN